MRIAFDGTAAATQFAGVGRYARELLRALLAQVNTSDTYEIVCAASQRQAIAFEESLPPGLRRDLGRIPVSERALTAIWQRLRLPIEVDWWLHEAELFHGPDFVLPPTKLPSVVTIHDLSYVIRPDLGEPSLVSYLSRAVPRSLARADQIITVSASVAAELVDAYPEVRDRVRAIPNGVFVPNVGSNGRTSKTVQPTVLIVGTVEPRKNHLALLDAMTFVRETFPETRLVIAGRIGWRSAEIMERVRHEVATQRVEFVESPNDAELESIYRQADVFVYPSFYEGFGLPVLEAMARGVPVVASSIPALTETAGNAALFAAPTSPEEIAHQVIRAMSDSTLRDTLVRAGLERVTDYSWSETARRTRLAYEAAIERRTG